MGNYSSWGYTNYPITKEQHDYLLPVYGIVSGNKRIFEKNGVFVFMGNKSEHEEMLQRIKYMN